MVQLYVEKIVRERKNMKTCWMAALNFSCQYFYDLYLPSPGRHPNFKKTSNLPCELRHFSKTCFSDRRKLGLLLIVLTYSIIYVLFCWSLGLTFITPDIGNLPWEKVEKFQPPHKNRILENLHTSPPPSPRGLPLSCFTFKGVFILCGWNGWSWYGW